VGVRANELRELLDVLRHVVRARHTGSIGAQSAWIANSFGQILDRELHPPFVPKLMPKPPRTVAKLGTATYEDIDADLADHAYRDGATLVPHELGRLAYAFEAVVGLEEVERLGDLWHEVEWISGMLVAS
jgi:hypothetical protein